MLALFRALPIVWQIASGAAVLAAIGGSVTYWSVHEYNKGWHAAIAAIAKKDQGAIDESIKAKSEVDACYRRGGTWSVVDGVCQ